MKEFIGYEGNSIFDSTKNGTYCKQKLSRFGESFCRYILFHYVIYRLRFYTINIKHKRITPYRSHLSRIHYPTKIEICGAIFCRMGYF